MTVKMIIIARAVKILHSRFLFRILVIAKIAVSGALMVIGGLYGQRDKNDPNDRLKSNYLTEEFMKRFKEDNNSCICCFGWNRKYQRINYFSYYPNFAS